MSRDLEQFTMKALWMKSLAGCDGCGREQCSGRAPGVRREPGFLRISEHGRAVDFLSRSGSEECANTAPSAWVPVMIQDVRALATGSRMKSLH
jgi:hypothetical protein